MDQFLKEFVDITQTLLKEEAKEPVAPFISTSDLSQKLDLSLGKFPLEEESFKQALESLVLHTPRVATKGFFNQLFGGRNGDAVLGELLSAILNNSMYTYKAAGPMVAIEKEIIKNILGLLGWSDERAGGILCPGGSMSNLMAMIMARDSFDSTIRDKGTSKKLTAYTSEVSHYSLLKNASFCGIGRDYVRQVPCDEQGRMVVEELIAQVKQDIDEGFEPFFVNATAGTTVLGAFDPIADIQQFCEKEKIWLHVDGAYCGAVLFSDRYRPLIEGVEKVNSFCLNAHKMLGTPLSCSILLTQENEQLYSSFSNDASYLYQTDGDSFNLGKLSMQCGRRNDALKLWTLWKRRGTNGLEKMVDQQFYLADYARDYIRKHPDYQLHSFRDSISVCFNYKNLDPIALCTKLYENSKLMVGYGSNQGQNFIRLVTINAQHTEEEIQYFFHTLESFAHENMIGE